MKKITLLILITLIITNHSVGQVYSNKIVGTKNATLKDSIEKTEYPYLLPIWGKKVTQKGFLLPYSAGVGVNYLWQRSSLVINNLMVGFNGGEMRNVDEIIRFNDATSEAGGINIRPDIWLFPFLNIYGIIAFAKTSTAIDAGVWLPDMDSTWSEVTTLSTKANFDAHSLGFGMTPTFGVGGLWVALDMNCVWSHVSALNKPVFTFVFGPRLGKTFKFKKPDMNVAFWVGGFRLKYTSGTTGSVNLSELFPPSELQPRVDAGFAKIDETYQEVESWWNGLSPLEQRNPLNVSKYNAANKALEKASDLLTAVNGAINDGQSATVQYSLDKSVKDMWNFLVGGQFQINRHIMVRGEYGFLGTRHQFIGGLQYRFGL